MFFREVEQTKTLERVTVVKDDEKERRLDEIIAEVNRIADSLWEETIEEYKKNSSNK